MAEWAIPRTEIRLLNCVLRHILVMSIRYNRKFHNARRERLVPASAIWVDTDLLPIAAVPRAYITSTVVLNLSQ